MPGQRFGRIPVDELDKKATIRVNAERGIEFRKELLSNDVDGLGNPRDFGYTRAE